MRSCAYAWFPHSDRFLWCGKIRIKCLKTFLDHCKFTSQCFNFKLNLKTLSVYSKKIVKHWKQETWYQKTKNDKRHEEGLACDRYSANLIHNVTVVCVCKTKWRENEEKTENSNLNYFAYSKTFITMNVKFQKSNSEFNFTLI